MKQSKFHLTFAFTLLGLVLASLLAGCNRPSGQSQTTPTPNITQVYQTVEARLTVSASLPLDSPTPQVSATQQTTPAQTPMTPSPSAPAPSATAQAPLASVTAQRLCDQASAGTPIDITIPDDTTVQAGLSFVKIWRLVNVGSCTWDTSYAAVFFSGEQMGAPAVVPLKGQVAPGQSVDISVEMLAPSASGSYQGNWKLRNGANVLFGIGPNGSAPFWVRILVLATASVTPSPSPTSPPPSVTPTITPSPTQPPIQVSGPAQLNPNDQLDLDSLQINPGTGQDLVYARNASSQLTLTALETAGLSVFGSSQPDSQACKADDLSQSPLLLDDLSSGTYLCYRTGENRGGWARLVSFDAASGVLNLEILTWALP